MNQYKPNKKQKLVTPEAKYSYFKSVPKSRKNIQKPVAQKNIHSFVSNNLLINTVFTLATIFSVVSISLILAPNDLKVVSASSPKTQIISIVNINNTQTGIGGKNITNSFVPIINQLN